MRVFAILLCAALGAVAQVWPQKLPGAPALERITQAEVPRWGVVYVGVEYFIDPHAAKLDDPIARLQAGKVWCGSRVTVLQPISAKKRRESFEEQFRIYWPRGYNPKAPDARVFLAWANHPLKEQDQIEYVVDPSDHLYARLNGGPWATFTSADLVQAWLGYTFQGSPKNPQILVWVRSYLQGLRGAAR